MDPQITKCLSIRRRRRIRFVRRGVHDKKKLGSAWRRPKGRHNKMRRRLKSKGRLPAPGFGSPALVRGLHPSGYREVLVHNETMLRGLEASTHAIRVAASVGGRRYVTIEREALQMGLRILNPRKMEREEREEKEEAGVSGDE
ncbi:MAG: 50S ribosomal protein L32e [Methanomicrobiales archaeon]|nr:50S ribosomal protein L32e [Methanomicrobiales archaeon]